MQRFLWGTAHKRYIEDHPGPAAVSRALLFGLVVTIIGVATGASLSKIVGNGLTALLASLLVYLAIYSLRSRDAKRPKSKGQDMWS
jgi:uncharacterized membrane protein YfcA